MKIIDFTEKWIPQAMELAIENYREEQSIVSALPDSPVIPPLDYLAQNGLTAAAVEGDTLLGYLGAFGPWEPVFCTGSVRGVFSPLHAHAAVKENRVRIYQKLYQAAGEKWVNAGAGSHAVTLYRHDRAASEAFFDYGFGARCLDLIRYTDPSDCAESSDCRYFELPTHRHTELRPLRESLSAHLAQSPCFMVESPDNIDSWIKMKESSPPRIFAAEADGRIIAYIEVKDEGENFAVSASGIMNICGAYCVPDYRGRNVAKNLLFHLSSVLRAEGTERIGVDCESFNPTALNFWKKHFDIYTHSLVRRIDDNAVGKSD